MRKFEAMNFRVGQVKVNRWTGRDRKWNRQMVEEGGGGGIGQEGH